MRIFNFRNFLDVLKKDLSLQIFWFILVSIILQYGNFVVSANQLKQFECYGKAFFVEAATASDRTVCSNYGIFINNIRSIPREYPLLSLIPFSLPLTIPFDYRIGFSLEIFAVSLWLFIYLYKIRPPGTSLVLLFYLFAGGIGTLYGRYDLWPAALVLFTLHSAIRKKFTMAYLFLAVAALLKVYPLFYLAPLFIFEQSQSKKPDRKNRLRNLIIFMAVITGFFTLSLFISPPDTAGMFRYHFDRPVEIGSVQASLIWLLSVFRLADYRIGFGYGSYNLYGLNVLTEVILKIIPLIFSVVTITGLGYVYQKNLKVRLPLEHTFTAVTLLILVTGKVFSPQYIFWLIPLTAYYFGTNRSWIIRFGMIFLLTTLVYPFFWNTGYRMILTFFRNLLLCYSTILVYQQISEIPTKKTSDIPRRN